MKFINKKRFGSTVMAGALALSLAAPAFAANNTSTTITGAYTDIPIAVSVPTTGTAQINPYGLPVTITKSNDTTVDLVNQQITTKPLSVKNQGTVSLDMGVSSFLVTPTGDISIAAAKDVTKTIAVNLEVAGRDDTPLAVSSDSENLDNLIIDAFADEDSWAEAESLAAPAFAKGATASTITPAKQDDMAVLGAVTPKSEGFTYGKTSIALFRLTGDLAEEPANAGAADPWKETDGFSAAIVFKFTPHALVDAAVTLDQPSLNLAASANANLKATFAANDTELTVTSWAWATSDATVANTNTSNTTDTALVANTGTGNATITVTATLSDGTTRTATCSVTCA